MTHIQTKWKNNFDKLFWREQVLELDSKILKVLIYSFNIPSLEVYYIWALNKGLGD